ncbi:MAG: hypothetical protein IJR68_03600 [Fretibacterium sp.]|nr:hypothetical protein [Fretibacterium sp.]
MEDKEIPDVFIVTVVTERGDFEADMALPSLLTVGELRGKLIGILKILDGERFRDWRGCRLRYGHRLLQDRDNLAEAGAFEGSRLVVSENPT